MNVCRQILTLFSQIKPLCLGWVTCMSTFVARGQSSVLLPFIWIMMVGIFSGNMNWNAIKVPYVDVGAPSLFLKRLLFYQRLIYRDARGHVLTFRRAETSNRDVMQEGMDWKWFEGPCYVTDVLCTFSRFFRYWQIVSVIVRRNYVSGHNANVYL